MVEELGFWSRKATRRGAFYVALLDERACKFGVLDAPRRFYALGFKCFDVLGFRPFGECIKKAQWASGDCIKKAHWANFRRAHLKAHLHLRM